METRNYTSTGQYYSTGAIQIVWCHPQAEEFNEYPNEVEPYGGYFTNYHRVIGQDNPLWHSESYIRKDKLWTENPALYDVGGPYTKYVGKAWFSGSYSVTYQLGWCFVRSEGDWLLSTDTTGLDPDSNHPDSLPTPDEELNAIGSKVLASMSPTKPLSENALFIAEIGDLAILIPQGMEKIRSLRNVARAIATGTLTVNLGWKPLLSDIDSFIKLQEKVNRKINYILTAQDRVIRRSHDLEPLSFEYQDGGETVYPPFHGRAIDSLTCARFRKITITVKRRVTAGFVVMFDSETNLHSHKIRERLSDIITGNVIDPKLIYELIPFSWLVDYFTNLGAIVSTVTEHHRADLSTRILYAYISEVKTTKEVVHAVCQGSPKGDVSPPTFTTEKVWKRRIPIDPTEFSTMPFASLTDAQKANVVSLTVLTLTPSIVEKLWRKAYRRLKKLVKTRQDKTQPK